MLFEAIIFFTNCTYSSILQALNSIIHASFVITFCSLFNQDFKRSTLRHFLLIKTRIREFDFQSDSAFRIFLDSPNPMTSVVGRIKLRTCPTTVTVRTFAEKKEGERESTDYTKTAGRYETHESNNTFYLIIKTYVSIWFQGSL